jgi:hypothetical protein
MSAALDPRFIFGDIPKWHTSFKQNLWGTELVTIEPTTKSDTVFEFDFPTNSTLLFGPNSGFLIKGTFEKQKEDKTWSEIEQTELSSVLVQPNWFENSIKSIDVFHNNTQVKAHDVPRYSDSFVNTYLYANMHPEIKKFLCPESCHTGNGVPTENAATASSWYGTDENSEWRKYGQSIYQNTTKFRYVPPFTFPFYQQSNFCRAGRPPAALPMPVLGKMSVILSMKDDSKLLFAKAASNTAAYRFNLESVKLVVEEARLNPTFEKTFLSQKGVLAYEGNTHFGLAENITAGVMSHRLRLQDLYMPEGIFIFALPKTVLGGNFQFSNDHRSRVYSPHNIESVDVKFQNMPLVMKSPNFGNILDDLTQVGQLLDHQDFPPFGVTQNPKMLTLNKIQMGGTNSQYPHVYLNLCPTTPQSRLVPIGDNGSCITKTGNLDLTIKFDTNGATADVTYFVYIFYTDVSMLLDMKPPGKQFVPMYKRHRSNL